MILFRGRTYDVLKFLAQLVFPALATLYFTLAGIWHLPSAEEVVGTIVALDTFLGVLLQLSTSAYNKSDARFDGDMVIEPGLHRDTFRLELNNDETQIARKKEITFKVKRKGEQKGELQP